MLVNWRVDRPVLCLVADLFCFPFEKDGCVCFWYGEQAEDTKKRRHDQSDPIEHVSFGEVSLIAELS